MDSRKTEIDTAASRLAALVANHPRVKACGVGKVHVFPLADRLVVRYFYERGGLIDAGSVFPEWHEAFTKDEEGFAENLARNAPLRLPDELWDEKGNLDLQYLFLRVVADLASVSESFDDYDNLRAAALLRLLLLDEPPLIHRVNQIHNLPITFLVGKVLVNDVVDPASISPDTEPRLIKTGDGRLFSAVGNRFDPRFSVGDQHRLNWDAFLGCLVLKVEDHWVSVHELVSSMAYVEGLVHAGGPRAKRPADAALLRWRRMLAVKGRGPALDTLAAIGRVVSSSLAGLVDACGKGLQAGSVP